MAEFFSVFMLYTGAVIKITYSLALYLGMAFSLYSIAKHNNIKNPWIAFIPFFQYYIIGSLCEEYVLLGVKITKLQWFMVLLAFLQVVTTFGNFTSFVVSILLNILIALILHKFFYLFDPSKALIYAGISIFGRLPLVIVLFLIKDRPIVMSAGAYQYPFANR